MENKRLIVRVFLLMGMLLFLGGCSGQENPEAREAETTGKRQPLSEEELEIREYLSGIRGIEILEEEVDYSNPANWMLLPESKEKPVDTLYLYPTVYGVTSEIAGEIAPIDDPMMQITALYAAANQASAFEESTNVFAPYYRQFTVDSLLGIINDCPQALPELAAGILYPMLDYYFEYLNKGRPFILAGHSQGSLWLTIILEDYMKDHPEYLENMVAAYVIGYSVTRDYLERNPHLKFAGGATDTGVIISYNTEGPGNRNEFNCVVKEGAVSINPINWKLDETYAPAEENIGSLNTDGRIVAGYADARIDRSRGVVICENSEIPVQMQPQLRKFFGPESYHLQDYNLYYMNLKRNAADRIEAFLKAQSGS